MIWNYYVAKLSDIARGKRRLIPLDQVGNAQKLLIIKDLLSKVCCIRPNKKIICVKGKLTLPKFNEET